MKSISNGALVQTEQSVSQSKNEVSSYSESRILSSAAFKTKLNENPDPKFVLVHPMNKKNYLPISHIETELDECFLDWETVNFRWQVVTNEIIGTVELRVLNPVTGQWSTKTGAAAVQIRQSSGSAIDDVTAKIKNALEGDFPHLLSDCLRNAAKKLGRRFGRDLNRNFDDTYNTADAISITDLDAMQAAIDKAREVNAIKTEVQTAIDNAKTADDFTEIVRPALDKAAKSKLPIDLMSELQAAAIDKFKRLPK